MKIYVASSWRNHDQPYVVNALRAAGFEVYDFKNPKEGDKGFHWHEVGLPQSKDGSCTPTELKIGLNHPRAVEGFKSDFDAMQECDSCVLLLPCGRSAHLEAGWLAGWGTPVFVLALEASAAPRVEPELMYKLLQDQPIYTILADLIAKLKSQEILI